MQRKKDAQKSRGKATGAVKKDQENGTNGAPKELTEEEKLCAMLEEEARLNAEARSCTGTLAVHPRSRDVKIENFSITFFGAELLQDTMVCFQRDQSSNRHSKITVSFFVPTVGVELRSSLRFTWLEWLRKVIVACSIGSSRGSCSTAH